MFPNIEWLYPALILLGVAVCVFVVLPLLAKKYGMDKKTIDFYSIVALAAVAAGLGGAFFFQFIYDLFKFDFKLPEGYFPAMTFYGGLIVGGIVFILIHIFVTKKKPEAKSQFWIILRVAAPCVLVAHGFGRLGCFFNGCCYGIETNSFLGMNFPGHEHNILPTQLIEAFFLFALFALLFLPVFFKKPNFFFTDKSAIIYLFGYGVFRFVLEFFRGDADARAVTLALSPSQIVSIFMVALGAYLLVLDIKKGFFKGYTPPGSPAAPPAAPPAEAPAES